jgi:outer membrane protein assembly factor BamD
MRQLKYAVSTVIPVLALAGTLALAGCGARGPALEKLEADPLYLRGTEALQAKKWSDAIAAFERFTLTFPNHQRLPEARYRLAEAYMGRKEYVTAALEFNRLANDYPAGPWADDSRYMVCVSYYELAPGPQLDQEYTRSAIDHCQSLITYYPDSEFVPKARDRVTELTNRLAEKEFNTADFYFRKQGYDSSIVYFETVVREYPQTPWAPRALARMHEVYVILKYADEAAKTKEKLLKDYPDSPEAKRLGGTPAGGTPG